MKLEQQVCNLEFAQKLKGLGIEQKSLFYIDEQDQEITYGAFTIPTFPGHTYISTFTVAELGEMLPDYYLSKRIGMLRGAWACFDDSVLNRNSFNTRADTEADVRASMLVYLLENKII